MHTTLDKIEIKALKKDLNKNEENYPPRVSRAWARWIQDIDKPLKLPVNCLTFGNLEKCFKLWPATEAVAIPGHLQALRDKETVETDVAETQPVGFSGYIK